MLSSKVLLKIISIVTVAVLSFSACKGPNPEHASPDSSGGSNSRQTETGGGGNMENNTATSKEYAIGKPMVVETKYQTSDIPIISFNVKTLGAKGDGITDDTDAIQKALKDAGLRGGGVVFAPTGRYVVKGNLLIPRGVVFRGDWRNPEDESQEGVGTVLLAYKDKGNEKGESFIKMDSSSGMYNMAIYYPEQDYNNIKPYPWTIEQVGTWHMSLENVTLYNSYNGVKIGPKPNLLHYLKNVYATPLKTGVFIDQCRDIGRLENISFGPKYWIESGLEGSPQKEEAQNKLKNWMLKNAEGIHLEHSDWEYMYDVALDYFHKAITITKSVNGENKYAPNGQIYGLAIANSRIGMNIEDVAPYGYMISNSKIHTVEGKDTVAVRIAAPSNSAVQFNESTIGSKTGIAVKMEGQGNASFVNCIFDDWNHEGGSYAFDASKGTIAVEQCSFSKKDKHISLGKMVRSAAIIGNTFEGQPAVDNQTYSNADVKINHESLALPKAASEGHTYKKDLPKPASINLYDIKDYGAKGNGYKDDTEAIKKALEDAGKTGGTVYMPAGAYRVSENLIVPKGVELRGIGDVPYQSNARASVLHVYTGEGDENGKPFISLEPGSGARGFAVYHPTQDYKNPKPYPWTIQALGEDAWAINIILVNAYQGLDFGTHPSKNHYIRYISGTPLKKGVFVGNNDGDGWMENVHLHSFFWEGSDFPIKPNGEDNNLLWRGNIERLDAIIIGYTKNEHILGSFVFGANKGLYFINQKGKGAANATVIGHGTDGSETAIYIDDVENLELINTQLVAMESANTKRHIYMDKAVKGEVKMFGSLGWGFPDRSVEVNGGSLTLQQYNFFEMKKVEASIVGNGGRLDINACSFLTNYLNLMLGNGIDSCRAIGNISQRNSTQEQDPLYVQNEAGHKLESAYNIRK